ncbi:2124_t:CDS:1, partial [Ambispora gerdemannii]
RTKAEEKNVGALNRLSILVNAGSDVFQFTERSKEKAWVLLMPKSKLLNTIILLSIYIPRSGYLKSLVTTSDCTFIIEIKKTKYE